jgi:pimeloyl-ACP methyl ester carboxylesterase
MPDIDVNGQRLHYDDSGGGDQVVVFCHSFGMDGGMFAPQLAEFADDYRCITWDERAHGSSITDRQFDFWDSARDVLGLLDALQVRRAALVGTSQGGFLALRAAMLAPERVAALAVLGSSAAAEEPEQKAAFEQLHDAFVGGADGPPEQVLDAMAGICFGDRFDAEPWKARWRAWPREQFTFAFRALADRDDVVARLPEVAPPVLVLHGTDDRSYAPAHGAAICSGVAHCEAFVEVDGGAHFLSITDPAPVNEALRPFLAAHLSRPGG